MSITMLGFNAVATAVNPDFALGTDGWNIPEEPSAVLLLQHVSDPGPSTTSAVDTLSARQYELPVRIVERGGRKLQINQDLQLSTLEEGPQSASYTFTSSEDVCAVKLRYRFVTSEVPGGFFGSQFNDYFSVSIRAENTGESVFEANSMNGLGLAAFDSSSGSTAWRETILALKEDFFVFNDKVQVDLTVANVADGLFDSSVIVDFVEEITPGDTEDDECACALCQQWFDEQINDRGWIDQLPRCPCSVVAGLSPCTVRPLGSDVATGTLDGVNWSTDLAMNPCVDFGFHPGAGSCIRAAGPNGTGQQCCYDDDGDILEHGTDGAGTPDRNFPDHQEGDVDTYTQCCRDCPTLCELYIGKTDGTPGARSDPRHTSTGCV